MKVIFWGTRGSLPCPLTAHSIRSRLTQVLEMALDHGLGDKERIKPFLDSLPFALRSAYGGNTSCVQITGGQDFVLCDAGSGLRDFGNAHVQSGGLKNPAQFHIFISHLHWDHLQGFPFFVPAYVPGNRVKIYGCHEDLERAFVTQQEPPFFPLPLKELKGDISFEVLAPDREYEIAGFKVCGARQNHPGGSYGYYFGKDGKKVVYSTDSEHQDDSENGSDHLLAFFEDADLLIFDAQYVFREAIDIKLNWGHSSNIVGVELAARAQAKRLCLFHHEPTYDDKRLEALLQNTINYAQIYKKMLDSPYPEAVSMAYDGMEVEI